MKVLYYTDIMLQVLVCKKLKIRLFVPRPGSNYIEYFFTVIANNPTITKTSEIWSMKTMKISTLTKKITTWRFGILHNSNKTVKTTVKASIKTILLPTLITTVSQQQQQQQYLNNSINGQQQPKQQQQKKTTYWVELLSGNSNFRNFKKCTREDHENIVNKESILENFKEKGVQEQHYHILENQDHLSVSPVYVLFSNFQTQEYQLSPLNNYLEQVTTTETATVIACDSNSDRIQRQQQQQLHTTATVLQHIFEENLVIAASTTSTSASLQLQQTL
ncbi:hypothetical protein ACTA71_000456 [Dictyostelium dimigraforme]